MRKIIVTALLLAYSLTLTSYEPGPVRLGTGYEYLGPYCPFVNGPCEIPPS